MTLRAPAFLTFAALLALLAWPTMAEAQRDTALVQGGIYQRPYIVSVGKTALGGYLEAHAAMERFDGVSEGLSFEIPRFNLFLYSPLGRRLRVTAEIEIEEGGEELKLETALADFVITPSLVVRGGVILVPIGAFNVNHDGPRYDFVARPLVATTIIPSTLSEVGFGVHGRLAPSQSVMVSYDAYLSNGLQEGIVLNGTGRTDLPSGKNGALFGEDANGSPALSGRVAAMTRGVGEVGLSHYSGVYNTWKIEGAVVDEARHFGITALDLSTALGPVEFRGEAAVATIDLPDDLTEVHGSRQWGVYLDATVPVWRPQIKALTDPVVSLGLRLDHVDWNVGSFGSTGENLGAEETAITLAISFRPAGGTVVRLNYRLGSTTDLQGNPATRAAGLALGFATYF